MLIYSSVSCIVYGSTCSTCSSFRNCSEAHIRRMKCPRQCRSHCFRGRNQIVFDLLKRTQIQRKLYTALDVQTVTQYLLYNYMLHIHFINAYFIILQLFPVHCYSFQKSKLTGQFPGLSSPVPRCHRPPLVSPASQVHLRRCLGAALDGHVSSKPLLDSGNGADPAPKDQFSSASLLLSGRGAHSASLS